MPVFGANADRLFDSTVASMKTALAASIPLHASIAIQSSRTRTVRSAMTPMGSVATAAHTAGTAASRPSCVLER